MEKISLNIIADEPLSKYSSIKAQKEFYAWKKIYIARYLCRFFDIPFLLFKDLKIKKHLFLRSIPSCFDKGHMYLR